MSLARTVALAALLVAVAPAERAAASAWSPERTAAAPISEPVVADTLRYQVRAGQPLLVSLPSRVGGGVNIFLSGFIPTENMRFRTTELTFKVGVAAGGRGGAGDGVVVFA